MRRNEGFSLLELLIAGTLLTVLLSLLASLLVQQSDLNQRTQAQNEAQDKARVAMQLVVQDLQLSGAEFYVDANGDVQQRLGACDAVSDSGTSVVTCFAADDDTVGGIPQDDFGSVYITTTRDRTDVLDSAGNPVTDPSGTKVDNECRRVYWALEGNDLLRADLPTVCSTPGSADPESTSANSAFSDVERNLLASNILAFNVTYRCSNGNWLVRYPDVTLCPPGTSYLRSAIVSLYAASDDAVPGTGGQTFGVVEATTDGSGTRTIGVTCPDDRRCLGLNQEVLLPNLRN